MSKRTPGKWFKTMSSRRPNAKTVIIGPDCEVICVVNGSFAEPNAHHIVTCVNNFDALVNALETILKPMEKCAKHNELVNKTGWTITFSPKQLAKAQEILAQIKVEMEGE